MKTAAIRRMRQVSRRLLNAFASRALILAYHRVNESPSDPQLLSVAPQRFAEHLECLRKAYRPTRLRQLVRALRDGTIPHGAVVLTFDDGYADNLHHARPLLERYDVPATVFVTTGCVGHDRELWWDELDRLLLQPGTLPERLRLSVSGSSFEWELGEDAYYGEEAFRAHCRWNVLETGDPTSRQRVYRSLHQLLRPMPGAQRQQVLEELRVWVGAESGSRSSHQILTADDVGDLEKGNLVEVGAHTVDHPVLSSLPPDAQRAEIRQSKTRLEEILGHPVASFAYPYGGRADYTAETAALVREAGFACACANFPELVRRSADRFQLPRVLVRDWDGDAFATRLAGWFRG
jgi:peptidoglycan/xylan/chitin deacetylase (PgdA/CDA1 family)